MRMCLLGVLLKIRIVEWSLLIFGLVSCLSPLKKEMKNERHGTRVYGKERKDRQEARDCPRNLAFSSSPPDRLLQGREREKVGEI